MTSSALLLVLALGAGPAGPGKGPDTILVVSIDALHPEAIARAPMPRLQRLMKRGAATLEGWSTVPPKTLVAHTAMLTGMAPEASGKTDNDWEPGEPTVEVRTVFDAAKAARYRTALFYAKPKLGYLVSAAVDLHALAPGDGVARVRALLAGGGRTFTVLHLSGLEHVGMKAGWLSPEYLARAKAIDAELAPLLDAVEARGRFLLVVTSDHAGHGTEHGTEHPEDSRRPVIAASDLPLWPKGWAPAPGVAEVAQLLSSSLGVAPRR